jgi:hypothetical protein
MSDDAKTNCCGENKLCALTCCPCDLDVEKIKPLVKDAKFICQACGRGANSEANLCQPIPID